MFRRIPKTVILLLLGLAVALAPMACGSDDTGSDSLRPDAAGEVRPDSMTAS